MAPVALKERHGLLERLARIHRSVSDGAPLPDVLTAVAAGAADLLGDPVAGIRIAAAGTPPRTTLAATAGLTAEQAWAVREGFVGKGAGGRTIAEGRLLVIEDHDGVVDDIAAFLEGRRQSALSAPVRARGRVVGSLTVATPTPGRRYGPLEQEILAALAEHAGLALLEAGAIEDDPAGQADDGGAADERLRQAQAPEAAAALAERLASELNHALSVVLGHAAVLGARPLDPAAQEDLADLVAAAERGAALVHRLGQFGRRDQGEPEIVDAAALLAAAARQAVRAAPALVDAEINAGPVPLPVRIDPGKLREALAHVLDNALAAGGRLEVTAREAPGLAAELTIADTGAGMAAAVLARALEPGFTTRPAGSGAGLGLSVAHRIVQRAGGRLGLRSAPGEGTSVMLVLPLADEAAPAEPAPAAPGVVVVHDDAAVRAGARAALEAAGHSVLVTPSADAALAAARGGTVTAVLIDDALPEPSGQALVDRFADVAPQASVIVMSRYAGELAAEDDGGFGWLQKPVHAAALAAAVSAATNPRN